MVKNLTTLLKFSGKDIGGALLGSTVRITVWTIVFSILGVVFGLAAWLNAHKRKHLEAPWNMYRYFKWLWILVLSDAHRRMPQMPFLRDERLDQRATEARAPQHGHPGDASVQESTLRGRQGLYGIATYSTIVIPTPLCAYLHILKTAIYFDCHD